MQKSVDAREGALSAVECLTYKLGRFAPPLCYKSPMAAVSAPVPECFAVCSLSSFAVSPWPAHSLTVFVEIEVCFDCQALSRRSAEQLSHSLAAYAERLVCHGHIYANTFVVICRLFEPYVIHVIGKLLNCYSDSARLVREGAHAAARAIMGNLSGQGQ